MDTNQNNIQNQDEEFDLRDLVMALWRRKVIIITITLIAAILAGIISFFIISPVYHTNFNIVINIPETYHTQYGDYTLPITTNQQYINLLNDNDVLENTINDMGYEIDEVTIEDLRKRITINTVSTAVSVNPNIFNIKVSADNPAEAKELAQTLYDNYLEFIDIMTVERAVDFYYNDSTVNLELMQETLENNQEILKKNEELIAETPQTIDQKEVMEEIQDQMYTSGYVVLENIINPVYTKIGEQIIANKQAIYTAEDAIRVYSEYLEELDIVKKYIDQYYETGVYNELETGIVSIVKTSVYLPSSILTPDRKTSPNNSINIIIGTLLGGVISVMIVIVKEFWVKKEQY